MIKRLPKWVEIGGFSLTFTAGYVNAVGVLGFQYQAVSHLTGISTYLSIALAENQLQDMMHLITIALSFVAGAILSGAIIRSTALEHNSGYSLALVLESLLLFAAMKVLIQGNEIGHYFASAACGLQNAMTTTFSGAIVRTTHLSGIFTDLGVMLGLRLRGQKLDNRRILLYITLISGFLTGGMLGAYMFNYYQFKALFVPATLSALLAMTYGIFWMRQQG